MKKKINIILLSVFGLVSILFYIIDYNNFILSFFLSYNFYLLSSTSSLFLILLFKTINSQWQINIENILLSFSKMIPYYIPLYIIIALNNLSEHSLISQPSNNEFLQAYTNPLFISIRQFSVLIFLSVITVYLQKTSIKAIKHSGLLLFLVTFFLIIVGIDFSFSFSNIWFNAVWSFYYLCSGVLIALSLLILYLPTKTFFFNNQSFNLQLNLGKLLFTFILLWSYFLFIQYLIAVYSGIENEIAFFLSRAKGVWEIVFYLFIIFIFLIPFFILLFKKANQNLLIIKIVSISILLGQIFHFYWLLYPSFNITNTLSLILSLILFIFFLLIFNLVKKLNKFCILKK